MESHVRILGVLSILSGGIGGLSGIIFFYLSAGPAAAAAYGPIIGYTIVGLMWLMLILAIPSILLGIGLMHFKPWARSIGTVVAIIELLNVPVGTILGIYALWVLLSVETDPLFSPRFKKRLRPFPDR